MVVGDVRRLCWLLCVVALQVCVVCRRVLFVVVCCLLRVVCSYVMVDVC